MPPNRQRHCGRSKDQLLRERLPGELDGAAATRNGAADQQIVAGQRIDDRRGGPARGSRLGRMT